MSDLMSGLEPNLARKVLGEMDERNLPNLLPCPFCGAPAEFVYLGPYYPDGEKPEGQTVPEEYLVGVGCSKCPVIFADTCDYKPYSSELEAAASWNRQIQRERAEMYRRQLGGTNAALARARKKARQ